jgi:hypothetical protein
VAARGARAAAEGLAHRGSRTRASNACHVERVPLVPYLGCSTRDTRDKAHEKGRWINEPSADHVISWGPTRSAGDTRARNLV